MVNKENQRMQLYTGVSGDTRPPTRHMKNEKWFNAKAGDQICAHAYTVVRSVVLEGTHTYVAEPAHHNHFITLILYAVTLHSL